MGFSFQSCPIEVINEIIRLLELDDLRNLRLSCKTLAAASNHADAFKSKHVELTEQALRVFAEGTQAGGVRCLVQELTLSGMASGVDTPRRIRGNKGQSSRQSKVNLLSESFDALAKNGATGRLASLSLEVAITPDLKTRLQPADARAEFDWKPVWQAAADTFHTTFPALAASALRIESLNLFNGTGQQRCSLACHELSKIDWDDQGLAESLQSVRSLSLSTSNRVFKFDKDEYGNDVTDGGSRSRRSHPDGDLAMAQDGSNFSGLANLFRLLEQLESFEMHYFRLRGELRGLASPADWCHEKLFQHIVELGTLPNLTRCKLRGIYARETDLLAFIKRTGVCELSLENVFLSSGTFRSIFDYCTSGSAPITKLYLDVLYEMSASSPMVLFLGPGRSRLGYDVVGLGSELLQRNGDHIKQPISYHTPPLPPMGSPAIATWMAFQRREYGHTQ